MGVSEEAPAPAPAPRTETAAAARKPEAAAAAPLADLDEARGCAHAVYFSFAMAWGCYYEVFTFFLEETGRMSPDAAAAASTCVVMHSHAPTTRSVTFFAAEEVAAAENVSTARTSPLGLACASAAGGATACSGLSLARSPSSCRPPLLLPPSSCCPPPAALLLPPS